MGNGDNINGWITEWGHCQKRNIQIAGTIGDAKIGNKLLRLELGRINGEVTLCFFS